MHKDTTFIGQPILNQILFYLKSANIKHISGKYNAERYVKKFSTRHHLVIMLFSAFEGYNSLREVVLGMLSNAHKLIHLGLPHMICRSTLSDANKRRSSAVFGEIYMSVYSFHGKSLSDSRLSSKDLKRLYAMDSTTISLFKEILKGCGRNPKTGKKKGGIKAHTVIKVEDKMPCLVRFTEATRHDHVLLSEVHLESGSIITFDKGYVDYAEYERFTKEDVFYVTRLKDNAVYQAGEEFDIPDEADNGILKDEEITLKYGKNDELKHRSRRIVYYDAENDRVFEFITNNFDLAAETVALMYKKRWQIELLFKQLKQNFQLKYFLGDNQNAIEIQIWCAMLANLLLMLVKSKVKKSWAFSNLVSVIRGQLMNYINIYSFLENPEKSWRNIIEERQKKQIAEPSLFENHWGLDFFI
jgi:hypothetical protein